MSPYVERLTQLLAKLPGIGPRHAARIVLALMDRPEHEVSALASGIAGLKQAVRRCRECFNVAEAEVCRICADPGRSESQLLVVERVSDLQSIERSGLWRGRYHVMGTLEPGSDGTDIKMPELIKRVRKMKSGSGETEVVLATGADAAGEATALYAQRELKAVSDVRVTRLARGLASGSHVEHADELTLQFALESRK